MTTLQEYLNSKYPTKEEKKNVLSISNNKILYNTNRYEYAIIAEEITKQLGGGELDLREYENLSFIDIHPSSIPVNSRSFFSFTKIDVRGLTKLKNFSYSGFKSLTTVMLGDNFSLDEVCLSSCSLDNIDFFKKIPYPEKMTGKICINGNNIQPTNIDIFSRFINICWLRIGNGIDKHRNRFYGNLKTLKNLKLDELCIRGTDVDEGLEYLDCSSFFGLKIDCKVDTWTEEKGKVIKIKNELRPFNYDLEAWQLANPDKMLISKPELFTNPDSKEKWINALKNKLEESQKELSETDKEKVKRIARLESKISELEQAKQTISQQTQTEFETQDKGTQTDLTMEQIKTQEQENEQLKEQIKKLEAENNKTWYQKVIDKFGKK